MSVRIKAGVILVAGLVLGAGAQAQSTVGELLAKGGKQTAKADFLSMVPFQLRWKWPNGAGEEDLVMSADGKITGTGLHYQSQTTSPLEGTWSVEDDGKICAPKRFTTWGSSSNLCWYGFEIGNERFASMKIDADSKLLKIDALTKVASSN